MTPTLSWRCYWGKRRPKKPGTFWFNLDFDDVYQYVTAEKFRLTIVSFDADFDRTTWGRQTPAATS
ncbi:MAG: hypothetical protein ABSE93_29465 [Terriglobia bacterium]